MLGKLSIILLKCGTKEVVILESISIEFTSNERTAVDNSSTTRK